MKLEVPVKKNRIAVTLLLIAAILVVVIFSLPLYSFEATVYTKKSSNTFVGDEKYQTVRAEIDVLADEYRAQGFDVKVDENVTERTNSKGETTSLVAFTISEGFHRNLWSFLGAGLNSSAALLVMLICLILSALCALAGTMSNLGEPVRLLDKKYRLLRSLAGWFALIALLLVPVVVMMNTYTFSRQAYLLSNNISADGADLYYAKMDRFLFDGTAGDGINAAIKGLHFTLSPAFWLLLPCFFAMIIGAVQLRHGVIKDTVLRGIMYFFIIVVCVITVYPYYVMLITAFRSNTETTDMYFQHMLPTKWEWDNLFHIVQRGVPRYLLNSLLIAGGATLVTMLCGIPAAYAMARMKFRGKKFFLGFVIMSQMFSPVVLLIGIAQLMSALHMNDSILGLVFINAAFNQAFAVWLLRGTFVSISPEMEQAALIDGCSTMKALFKILLPMAAPGIVTALIFVFINAWNEYTISTVLISTASNRPITVGITQFSSFNMIEWQYLFAASLLATIPVVILFMCIEKHLTAGLTSGGVKG